MLEIKEICAGYGPVNVLNDVRLSVGQGRFFGVLGHNGMGKTTLIRAITGSLPLTKGDIRFRDKSIGRLPSHRRARMGIGYVPQGRQIFPRLSVRENLEIAALASGNKLPATVDQIAAEFPILEPLMKRPGGLLSGGEQQILALGRALCASPELLLLDEPTEGVQPSIVEQMIDILARLHRERNLTTILVEQNLDFIRALADRIVVIEKGRLIHEIDGRNPDAFAELVAVSGFDRSKRKVSAR